MDSASLKGWNCKLIPMVFQAFITLPQTFDPCWETWFLTMAWFRFGTRLVCEEGLQHSNLYLTKSLSLDSPSFKAINLHSHNNINIVSSWSIRFNCPKKNYLQQSN